MYHVQKRLEISASHSLALPYESKCAGLHGHNWIIHVFCKREKLNKSGMVIDFATIKQKVVDAIDHKNLNDIFTFQPTAENIAFWIVQTIPHCYKATVQESENNIATYEELSPVAEDEEDDDEEV